MARRSVNTMVGHVLRPNLPDFLTATDYPQFHLATILGHDNGRNEARASLNDFDDTPVSKLPVFRPYPMGVNPQLGENVQLIQIGQTLAVFARQYRPPGAVTF